MLVIWILSVRNYFMCLVEKKKPNYILITYLLNNNLPIHRRLIRSKTKFIFYKHHKLTYFIFNIERTKEVLFVATHHALI